MGAAKKVVKTALPIVIGAAATAIHPAFGAAVGGIMNAQQQQSMANKARRQAQSLVPQGKAQPDPAAQAAANRKAVRVQIAKQGSQSRFFGGGTDDTRFFG